MNIIQHLRSSSLIDCHDRIGSPWSGEHWLDGGILYIATPGPLSAGLPDPYTDVDLIGMYATPASLIKPPDGYIDGFDRPHTIQHSFTFHTAHDPHTALSYRIELYSMPKFFQLLENAHWKVWDSLFVPDRCRAVTSRVSGILMAGRDSLPVIRVPSSWVQQAKVYLDQAIRAAKQPYLDAIWEIEDRYRMPKATTYQQADRESYQRATRVRNGLDPAFNRMGNVAVDRYRDLYYESIKRDSRFEIRKRQGYDNHWFCEAYRLSSMASAMVRGDVPTHDCNYAVQAAMKTNQLSPSSMQHEIMKLQVMQYASDLANPNIKPQANTRYAGLGVSVRKLLRECCDAYYGTD